MIGRRENKSKKEIGVMRSGKKYRVDSRKISHGKDPKHFIEVDYILF